MSAQLAQSSLLETIKQMHVSFPTHEKRKKESIGTVWIMTSPPL